MNTFTTRKCSEKHPVFEVKNCAIKKVVMDGCMSTIYETFYVEHFFNNFIIEQIGLMRI